MADKGDSAKLEEVNALLAAISRTQTHFIDDAKPRRLYETLLEDFLSLTQSEIGFIGEVLTSPEGLPYLRTHAISNISWNDKTRKFYEQGARDGLSFYNLENLFGRAIAEKRIVISNNPTDDSRSTGLPDGHPKLTSFLAVPVFSNGEMVGVIGVANRSGGYEQSQVEYLKPLLQVYGRIIEANREKQCRRELEARLQAVVETASDAIIVIDMEGFICSANPAAEKIFGHTIEHLVGRNISILMPEPYRSEHGQYVQRYLQTGEAKILGTGREITGLHANGRVFPISLSVNKFKVDGKPFFAGVVRDISDYKAIERNLRSFKETLDQIQDCVFIFDAKTLNFTYANQGAMKQVGYSEKELLSMTPLEIKPEYDAKQLAELVAPLVSGKRESITFTTVHQHKSGTLVPVEILLQYVHREGEAPSFVAVVRDVAERIKSEEALRVSDERLRRSQVFANIGTWDWSIETGDLYWSERIGPLFGYPSGNLETTYDNFLNAVHPDDRQRVIDAVNACVERGEDYNIEHRCVWPDGTVRWMLERGDVVRDDTGEAKRMLGVVQDISELKQIQKELVSAKEEAERANRAKSEFLSRMSHELRTPLNAIMGFAQLFEYEAGLNEEAKKNAQQIYDAGRHLRILIDDVLDLSKIEAGHVDVSVEPVSIRDITDECRTLIKPLADEKAIVLVMDVSACEKLYVAADRTRLKQVMINLLSNAVKYNRQSGIVTLSCDVVREGVIRMTVADSGRGIPEADLKHVFQPFSRVSDKATKIEGTGIGLSITKQFVEMMGGYIGVESKVGIGSRFWVELNLIESNDGFSKDVASSSALSDFNDEGPMVLVAGAPDSSSNRILVVEDNPTNQLVFRSQLHSLGFDADIVGGSEAAIEYFNSNRYALVLTDIHMPGMDGYALAKFIRGLERGKEIPIIAVTANVMEGERDRVLASSMDDYIPKPVDIKVLRKTLSHWLAKVEEEKAEELSSAPEEHGVLDVGVLTSLVGDDVLRQKEIVDSFLISVPENLAAISGAIKKKDVEAVRFSSHRFKSSAGAIGAVKLTELCQAMEHAAVSGAWGKISELEGEVDASIHGVVGYLNELFSPNAALRQGVLAENVRVDIQIAMVVDDDPVVLRVLANSLEGLGVENVITCLSGAEALANIDDLVGNVEVVFCDLNMPHMDGIEFLRHLSERDFSGEVVVLSGEDNRILQSALALAKAHSFKSVCAISKPISRPELLDALSRLKHGGRGAADKSRRSITEPELRQALENNELVVYYQPKVNICSRALVGVEALIRWNHPEVGLMFPDNFIPMAEENGMIDELTDCVFKQSFAQLREWKRQGLNIKLSINLAVGTVGRSVDFPERVMKYLEAYGLSANDVVLELTESGVINDLATSLDTLVRLRLKGITLSIDDFGTGYSTFSQLQGIPFGELKIDKTFVSGVVDDPAARAILESSVILGQKLEMNIVAEGVESQQDWDFIQGLGCHVIQGFFVAKSMPGDELLTWERDWRSRAMEGAVCSTSEVKKD